MNTTVILQQKCSSMSFSELHAFRQLTNSFYLASISDAAPGEDEQGLREEMDKFNKVIEDIIGHKVSTFLPQLV